MIQESNKAPESQRPPRVLLLSAYDALSHRRWRESLVAMLPECDWQVLTLPPRHFSWRVRGNALSWAFGAERAVLEQGYDLVIATSMCDLAGLRAFLPALARVPALVYVHENQFDYPQQQARQKRVEPAMMSLTTLAAADQIVFNSAYNRGSFLHGARRLLRFMPDRRPLALIDQIEQRSCVMPVILPNDCFVQRNAQPGALRVIWNHRWEYDKAPDRLLNALRLLRQRRVEIRLALIGQQFRQVPQAIEQIQTEFRDWLWVDGPVAGDQAYRQVLAQGDVAVSTALHDFQGLAVLEAMAAGCLACVPDRLAYPEFVPKAQLYAGDTESAPRDAEALAVTLQLRATEKARGQLPDPTPPEWLAAAAWRPAWQQVVSRLTSL